MKDHSNLDLKQMPGCPALVDLIAEELEIHIHHGACDKIVQLLEASTYDGERRRRSTKVDVRRRTSTYVEGKLSQKVKLTFAPSKGIAFGRCERKFDFLGKLRPRT